MAESNKTQEGIVETLVIDGAIDGGIDGGIDGEEAAAGAPLSVVQEGRRKGLKFERFFTTPGVHPYDEIEWELRDAVITNWRDQSVSFEQRGVEFPTSWSMNATTIVAQKYFRGTLGTDERERSVRQMVDRVADTMTRWGIEGGYFIDDESAEIFNLELKHLLVNQKAAFNSPVWFNVGVEEHPQCSACQPYDALVSTPEGLVPIGSLVEDNAVGRKVFDASGVTRIVAVKNNGNKHVLRIHLKSGDYLDVTPDHLVWKQNGGRFVEAGELLPGDTLSWHRTYSNGEGEIDGREVAEASLAGWLQSDGFVGQYEGTNRSLTIEAMTVTDAEKAWVTGALDIVFPDVHRHERVVDTQDPTLDCRRTRLYGDVLADFVEAWGLRDRGVDMQLPARLLTAPLPVVAAYLRSLFQAEGYVTIRDNSARVAFDMISEDVVRGVQKLLLRFGIFSRMSFKADRRENRHGCWSLSISNLGDRMSFAEEIGFIDARKADKLEQSFELVGKPSRETKKLTIGRIEDLGIQTVYDIQTESGEYLSGNLRVHNCFILSVEDTMGSILNWYVEEGTIFKGGSGSGVNLSSIRSSREQLKGGGEASGPVSFMRGADASAGTIKSGGKTRRAAKMVILNVDHPDVEEFIWTKAKEEKKIRVLREAGFDMDLDSPDYASVQYQNANNSIRVTDEFMQAYEADGTYPLRAVTTGEVIEDKSARDVMRQFAQAAWECADPGMQFDTTINDWHTCPESGRINGSNPCFTADAMVHTDKGMIRFDELIDRVNHGEHFGVYTHDATNPDAPADQMLVTSPEAFLLTGTNPIVKLTFTNGMTLRCTPNHRIWTTNRGYVEAMDLTGDDQVKVLDLPAPAVHADWLLPVSTDNETYRQKGDHAAVITLPEKWSEEFAHYVGWLVGDGSISGDTAATIYGSHEEQTEILPKHRWLLGDINGGNEPKTSVQANGTAQLRASRRAVVEFLLALGLTRDHAADKRLPWAAFQAPEDAAAALLRGLFDADGTVVDGANGTRYVGLGSRSIELLRDVQRLLTTFGVVSSIYTINHRTISTFEHTLADGTQTSYQGSSTGYDLRITGQDLERFSASVGFTLPSKQARLSAVVDGYRRYDTDRTTRLAQREDEGFEQTYNLTEPRNHSYVVNGIVVRNCSEYMHLDNSACNLASLNLKRFYDYDAGRFDVDAFTRAVEVIFTAQEISVGFSSYPTDKIGKNAIDYRELGIGYANLGGLLMSLGLPYDSDEGRAWCGAITALLTGHSYRSSALFAEVVGPFNGYKKNAKPMQRVIGKHRAAVDNIDPRPVQPDLLDAARQSWDDALQFGGANGFRNSQASVLAPTGTIGLMMDCDTTGIEPDLGLVKTKKMVGGGTMQIVNQTVPQALSHLQYTDEQVEAIVAYIDEHKTIKGAPALKPEHEQVFQCAMGDDTIHYMGHVKMMAAAQPFISGAISKTVNLPEEATVADIEQLHVDAWKLGIKAIAIYRDNCKVAQPLSVTKKADASTEVAASAEAAGPAAGMVRRKLPKQRPSQTISFQVADAKGYLTAGEYPGDGLGEIFLKLGKQGSTLSGLLDAFAIAMSIGLQYGVPLETFVQKFMNMRFEPAGMTDDSEIRFATSIVDYISRKLAIEYLPFETREALGIYTLEERTAMTEGYGDTTSSVPTAPSPQAVATARELPTFEGSSVPVDTDAPLCLSCGVKMKRAGSCHVCESCGATSGCS